MAASKRDFQDFNNKEEFNFSINDGIITFPTLYNLDSKNHIRIWKIYFILKNNNEKINIKKIYINNEDVKFLYTLYKNLKVEIYTESGIQDMKITKSSPTLIISGKNIGKSNETNIITQGLIEARSKYLKKIDAGYNLSPENIKTIHNKIPYPMALHKYDEHSHHIVYPCYIQPKLDGIRILAYYDSDLNLVIFKSRRLKNIEGFEYIKKELKSKLIKNPDVILDGELYGHCLELQEISGIVRNEEKSSTTKILSFYIFDCFNIHNPKWKFNDRIQFVNNNWKFHDRMCLVNKMTENNIYALSVITEEVNNVQESDKLYKIYINIGYEGIVYKNKFGLYKYSFDREQRSYDNLKRKHQFDDEFEIVDFSSGTAGHKDAVVFILKTKNGKTFHSVPKWTIEERIKIYNICKKDFENTYKEKLATVIYDDLSKDGIPLRSRISVIRDYE